MRRISDYPEAVNWFSVNLGKEKIGKETNMNMTGYLEEEEVQKLIQTAPTLQKIAFLAYMMKVEQRPGGFCNLLILI
jgi:hypothetical protein